ncbi:MAG: bifunctional folylpolyglutamate synthase/dihydrofolate synthase [Synergistaceae bacterium]|jgi:dihydrofolate synthase/folylpolyglutamate synthase|nr:bifunctional folylpolyglutamate synthase/dihydrofolate synthase [Synergistaceae bacterium]
MFGHLMDDIANFSSPGIHPGLERTARLLSVMGSPHKKFKAVHVLGTNGKGSTAAALDSIFIASGMKTALYTSPHLVSLQERLRIRGLPLPPGIWEEAFRRVRSAVESDAALMADKPTFFENLTALCFHIIAESGVDVAVIEAGMGGRFDSTSLCDPVGIVITPIGMDHTQYLGSTLAAIASEKFAAIRKGVPAFYAADDEALTEQFAEQCERAGSPFLLLDRLARADDIHLSMDGTAFAYKPLDGCGLSAINDINTPLIGVHQAENAARTITIALKLRELGGKFSAIGADEIRSGLRRTDWPGRFEVFRLPGSGRAIILDGAHNEHAFKALETTVASLIREGAAPRVGAIVFAVMKDKDIRPILSRLRSFGCPVYCTQAPTERSMSAGDLAELATSEGANVRGAFPDAMDALSEACAEASPSEIVLCCGSLFLVGHVKNAVA